MAAAMPAAASAAPVTPTAIPLGEDETWLTLPARSRRKSFCTLTASAPEGGSGAAVGLGRPDV